MKITALCENTAVSPEIIAEHGLSLYIETQNHKILFDMGQTDAFLKNAEHLGIDLSQVDLAVLSHGHYDHGGGIRSFLQINQTAPVYVSRAAFGPHYNGTEKYIGLDPSLKSNPRLIYVDDQLQIDSQLSLYSCNDRLRGYPTNPYGLKIMKDGVFQPDDFLHEQYLLIRQKDQTVLFSGCSHKGILNIADWFRPDVLVGGFHFTKLNPQTEDAAVLREAGLLLLNHPTRYITGHCTGLEQYHYLKNLMGRRLEYISAGMTLDIL